MTGDVLHKLPPPSWRGIPFPLSSIETSFSHDQIQHKFVYVAGALVETTGRNPFLFSVRIPFYNGIQAAGFEDWAGQVLFPDLFIKFWNAVIDGSSGEFVHPVFGPLTCKPSDVSNTITADGPRDGASISCRFTVSNDDIDALEDSVSVQSPMAQAMSNAAELDDEFEVFGLGSAPELANDKESFSSLISGVNDGTGNIGRVNSKIESTSAALDREDDVSLWPIRSALEDLRSSVIDLGAFPVSGARPTRQITVGWGTTLSALGIKLGVRTDDLVRMNPKLAKSPYVPVGTVVRYPFGTP